MTEPTIDTGRLRASLDALAARAARALGRWALERDLRVVCRQALWWLVPGAAVAFALALVSFLTGGASTRPPLWLGAAAALAGPIVFVLARLAWLTPGRRVNRRQSLGAFDTQLESVDRLVTADEFLAAPLDEAAPMDRFKAAAIADAVDVAGTAGQTVLQPPALPAWRVTPSSWWSVPAALVLWLATFWVGPPVVPAGATPESVRAAGAVDAAGAEFAASRRETPPRPRTPRTVPDQSLEAADPSASADASPRAMRSAQDTEGVSHAGGRTSSRTVSNALSSSGTPSNQQMSSNPLEDEVPQEQRPTSATPPKKADQKKPEPQATSATSGQGQSKSSSSDTNRIPATDRPDRAGMEKDDGRDEGAVQDQEEEEKTTGVERPSLRRNKPPVDRNLSPRPAGDEPNPDANGRSGPGARKKTRGVPAMILGIPTPDRVQGTSNPGRSKVTQEHSTPREEPQSPLDAEARLARARAFGAVDHPLLMPWMQSLIERYFLQLREKR